VLQPTLGDGWISRWTRQHTVTVALAIAVVLIWALVVYKVFREGRRLLEVDRYDAGGGCQGTGRGSAVTARIWVEPVRHSDGPRCITLGANSTAPSWWPRWRGAGLAISRLSSYLWCPGVCVLIFMASRANWNTFWHTALWVPHMVWRTAPHLRAWYPAFNSSGRSCFA
jgi:hypothetical protein